MTREAFEQHHLGLQLHVVGDGVSCADIHRAIGMGSAELIERVLGKPDPSVSAAHSRYYAPRLGQVCPLPGAADLLRSTARLGLDVVPRDQRQS